MNRLGAWLVGIVLAALTAGCNNKPASSPAPTPSRPSMEGIKEGSSGKNVGSDTVRP
jgi:hypothetical protein